MADDRLALTLRVEAGEGADAEELDQATRRLRQQLLELDVDSVDSASGGPPPPGARAAELAMVGGLLVTMARSPELLKTLVGAVQGWLSSQHGRSVELQIGGDTLKVGGLSAAEQRRLIDVFVERHAR